MEALEMVAVKGANIRKKDELNSVPAVMFPNIICTGLMPMDPWRSEPEILIQELSDRQKTEFPYFNEVG